MVEVRGIETELETFRFFDGMSEEHRQLIAGCGQHEVAKAGEYVFRAGDKADKFYLVRTGLLSVEVHVPGREGLVVDTLRDSDTLGWSWMVPPYVWALDARASELTRLISFDAVCLRGKMETDKDFAYDMFRRFIPVMDRRLTETRMRIVELVTEPAAE
ncbi:cyclic nucleotide-binding domain-containing protein [Consotaella salsifontis]|uniref:Cyclic nucleotide-binding domain-containing protein n=1 Tax=Consotaella salsifontis TaxID=1365950 RepID=A0A1T4SHN8_9HYPH|nr:cyclic nucleotide-binding domain-containing protein [Consotaella salsifontis]SKA27814.1 Cyclic nucleotide-binding domain-containing protein [Consotaella salsifontis]